jgi:hypothetical protein
MNFVVGPMLMSVIQAKYKGGLERFHEEGGMIGLAPGSTKEVVIFHPGLPEALKKDIREFLCKWKLTARFSEHTNGAGMDEAELFKAYSNEIGELCAMMGLSSALTSLHPLMVIITLIDDDISEPKVKEFVEALKEKLPSLVFGYVVYVEGSYCINREPADSVIMLEQLKRNTVIGEDDILNLKITLGKAQTIDDIINSL